jgi:hypothetical protein
MLNGHKPVGGADMFPAILSLYVQTGTSFPGRFVCRDGWRDQSPFSITFIMSEGDIH